MERHETFPQRPTPRLKIRDEGRENVPLQENIPQRLTPRWKLRDEGRENALPENALPENALPENALPENWGTPPQYRETNGMPYQSRQGQSASYYTSPENPVEGNLSHTRRTPVRPVYPVHYDTSSDEGIGSPRPKFNLRTFGTDSSYTIEEFLSTMGDYVDSFKNCPQRAMASVKSYLTGEAAALVVDAGATTWEEIRTILLEHYIPQGHDRAQQSALNYLKRERGENPSTLSVRVRVTAREAYPKLNRLDRDPIMINSFLKAWGDRDVERIVLANNMRSFDEVVQLAERMTLMGGPPSITSTAKSKPQILHLQGQEESEEINESAWARISKVVEFQVDNIVKDRLRHRRARSADSQPSSSVRTMGNQREPYRNPGSRDHYRTRTPSTGRQRGTSRGSRGQARSSSQGRTCYKCGGKGHFIIDCPSTERYRSDGTIDHERTEISNKNLLHDPKGPRAPTRPT